MGREREGEGGRVQRPFWGLKCVILGLCLGKKFCGNFYRLKDFDETFE